MRFSGHKDRIPAEVVQPPVAREIADSKIAADSQHSRREPRKTGDRRVNCTPGRETKKLGTVILRVPRSSRSFRRAGVGNACAMRADYAAGTRNEIFVQPSFTPTGPPSPSR
jgi:hypothetical protein